MPIVRISVGRRVFAPSWWLTALTIALCVLFVGLGRWQWQRGVHRQAQWDAFASGSDRALPLGARGLAQLPRYQRIEVGGELDGSRQFLLDNRTHLGRGGFEVLTPLYLADGRALLVDRGWVPLLGFRDRLPDVSLSSVSPVTLTGRIDELPSPGLAFGRMPPPAQGAWPRVTSYPDMSQLAHALGRALEPRLLLLDPQAPLGYIRDWQPPGLPPARHWSYAIQWWGFAATLLVIWALLSAPRTRS
jgi:cytochrome oxidase assembly protein ShyY1